MALIDLVEDRAHPLVRALRPHQWLKNLLVLVPVILDHKVLDSGAVGAGAVAFAAFCLCASGVYVLNDLIDIERDQFGAAQGGAAGKVLTEHSGVGAPRTLPGGQRCSRCHIC